MAAARGRPAIDYSKRRFQPKKRDPYTMSLGLMPPDKPVADKLQKSEVRRIVLVVRIVENKSL